MTTNNLKKINSFITFISNTKCNYSSLISCKKNKIFLQPNYLESIQLNLYFIQYEYPYFSKYSSQIVFIACLSFIFYLFLFLLFQNIILFFILIFLFSFECHPILFLLFLKFFSNLYLNFIFCFH